MTASAARSLGVRRLEAAVVALAVVAGFAVGGADAAVVAAVVGFSAAKSAESLRRALGDCGGR